VSGPVDKELLLRALRTVEAEVAKTSTDVHLGMEILIREHGYSREDILAIVDDAYAIQTLHIRDILNDAFGHEIPYSEAF
jgi:hypothetical protein